MARFLEGMGVIIVFYWMGFWVSGIKSLLSDRDPGE